MTAGVRASLRLRRGNFVLDADLSLPAKGVSGILGPSGCGKTMLLRCLAGLEPSVDGEVVVNGQTWQSGTVFLPPEERAVGVVFQDTRVFAHLTVEENLRYGLKRTPDARRRITFGDVVGMLGIERILDRRPDLLSGGESQRVAIGRALLTSPALLLLDEPMAALDYARKAEILPFLKRLDRELDIPIIHVSHDVGELTRLADTLATMDGGRILSCGPIAETLASLEAGYNTRALGVSVRARVSRFDDEFGLVHLEMPGGLAAAVPGPRHPPGSEVSVRFAARDISLYSNKPAEGPHVATFEATVRSTPDGGEPLMAVLLDAGEITLLSLISRQAAAELELAPGKKVFAVARHADIIGGNWGAQGNDG